MLTAGGVAVLVLLFSMLTADVCSAAGGYDYDSRLVYDLCAPDQIVSSEGGSCSFNRKVAEIIPKWRRL